MEGQGKRQFFIRNLIFLETFYFPRFLALTNLHIGIPETFLLLLDTFESFLLKDRNFLLVIKFSTKPIGIL